jgi:hypothetical protein
MADQPSVIELEDCPSTELPEDEAPTEAQNEPANRERTYPTEHELREEEICTRIVDGVFAAVLYGLTVGAFLFLCIKKDFAAFGGSMSFPGFVLCLAHLGCALYD